MIAVASKLRERLTLFYFSGTGNTKWAVEIFAGFAEALGSRVHLIPITDEMPFPDSLDAVDVVGVAHPLYGGDVPPIVKRFYGRLSERYVGRLLVILTYGYVNSLGRLEEERRMAGSGIEWYAAVKLVNNITTPKMPAAIPSQQVRARRMARALRVLRRLAQRVVLGIRGPAGVYPAALAGPIVRMIAGPAIEDHYSHIGVDRARCVLCRLCVEQCPTGSITYTDRVFHVDDRCTACMRCYSYCPVQAITIDGQYADPRTYPRHRGLD